MGESAATQFAPRFQQLRGALEAELRCKSNEDLAAACAALTPRAASLAALAQSLLSGAPYRLLRDALSLTAIALHSRGATAGSGSAELLRAAPRLWRDGLSCPNREVRVLVLSLLTELSPLWVSGSSGLSEDELQTLAEVLVPRLIEIMSERSFVPSPASCAQMLKAFCKGRGVAVCKHHRLPRLLLSLPARCRLGDAGATITELLLRLGVVGSPSALGSVLGAGLGLDATTLSLGFCELESDAGDTLDDESAMSSGSRFSDSAMVWITDKGTFVLRMHAIILRMRAPRWAELLHDHHHRSKSRVGTGHINQGLNGGEDKRDSESGRLGVCAGDNRVADETKPPSPAKPTGGMYVWYVNPEESSHVSIEACRCLYRLAVCGCASIPATLSPRALVDTARTLDCRSLLTEPPYDAFDRLSLSLSLSQAADADVHWSTDPGSAPLSDITFVLPDGRVHGHRALLAARSDYFRRMFLWEESHGSDSQFEYQTVGDITDSSSTCLDGLIGSTPALCKELTPPPKSRTVRIGSGSCASFRVLLRYIYSGSVVPTTDVSTTVLRSDGSSNLAKSSSYATSLPELTARQCVELSSFGRRYMLDELVREAGQMLRETMTASEVVPALLLCQMEGADDDAQIVFEWAVEHYDAVIFELQRGVSANRLGGHLPQTSALCESDLQALIDQLRAGMLRSRYGL